MIIDDKIRYGRLQYYINRTTAKISALLSKKVDKYEYLTGEKTLPSQQHMKGVLKKTIDDNGKSQVEALQSLDLNN